MVHIEGNILLNIAHTSGDIYSQILLMFKVHNILPNMVHIEGNILPNIAHTSGDLLLWGSGATAE